MARTQGGNEVGSGSSALVAAYGGRRSAAVVAAAPAAAAARHDGSGAAAPGSPNAVGMAPGPHPPSWCVIISTDTVSPLATTRLGSRPS